jgi:hypothetical protein
MSAVTWADAPPRPAGPPPAGRQGRGGPQVPANLGGAMKDMDRAYRALKADAVDDAKQEQALTDIATMLRDAAISKLQVPPRVSKLQGDEKTKAIASYRTMMSGLMRTLLDLEDAVTDKKADAVKKGFADIEEIMKQGHDEFAPKEQ